MAEGDSAREADKNESNSDRTELQEALKALNLDSDEDDDGKEEEAEEDNEDDEEKEPYDSDHEPDESPGGVGHVEEPYDSDEEKLEANTRDNNIRRISQILDSRTFRKREEAEALEYEYFEDQFDFPEDPEKWTEVDIQEFWADAPLNMSNPGWDPVWADEEDWEVVREEIEAGRDPPIAPFYVPYRLYYPAIPDNHYDISNPKSVIEELDRIEEFLKWASYIFPDGSSYEGTIWDDLAHGKGVYVADSGLVRYEGEWFRNAMEGHGVVEVDIPEIQPRPGSKLEDQMRAEGKIISTDYMSPNDKKWLEMDIEDSIQLAGGRSVIPFYENDEWVKIFGDKPEKGRYKYAGQWKHGRMHGCGVYEVNEHIIYGRFYFGEHLDDLSGCDAEVSALHAGIAEVAAAKARMFVNKPDGMVREDKGPYGDPQHPYFYEEEDVWMAPGFINQLYEVPDYWKTYVQDVDLEREMWLNSFYKSPLRIPMPAELEYWWEKDESPEFVLVNKEPEPDPEDPSRLIYSEDPLILHTRTGRLINYVDDEKYGIRLFWQPPLKEGEDVDPEKVEFLPLGFDEFYGRAKPVTKKEHWLMRLITSVENALKPMLDKVEKWTEESKKASEMNLKLIEHELELIEAEICLEEELEDLELELKRKQQEEEKAAAQQAIDSSISGGINEISFDEGEEEPGEEGTPSSFGAVGGGDGGQWKPLDVKGGNQTRKSPFSSLSLLFGSSCLVSAVPHKLKESFLSWRKEKVAVITHTSVGSHAEDGLECKNVGVGSISYCRSLGQQTRIRAGTRQGWRRSTRSDSWSRLNGLAQSLSSSGSSRRSKTCHAKVVASYEGQRMQDDAKYALNMMSIHAPHVVV